jgi:hypothetical protein
MSKEEDINQIYLDFVLNLEKVYGKFDSVNKKFESTSNSKIARDLFNSDSQFSRLINNTASEGELIRALGNINRFLEVTVLKSEISKKEKDSSKVLTNKFWILLILIITTIAISSFLFLNFKNIDSNPSLIDYSKKTKYDMLHVLTPIKQEYSFKFRYLNYAVNLFIKIKCLSAFHFSIGVILPNSP